MSTAKTVKAETLISLFRKMYSEKWAYTLGAAEEGNVDCSGAFVYAWKKLGLGSIPHGSNSIYRQKIGWVVNDPVPGYAAFKIKQDGQEPSKYQNDGIGNVYHIGLVDSDPKYILNAKGSKYGFCRDKCDSWTCYAPLKSIDYGTEIPEADMEQAKVVTRGGNLNLRAEPALTAQKITAVPNGETVGIVEEDSNGWTMVQYGTLQGYVKSEYLQSISQTVANSATVDTTTSATTTLINTEGVAITLAGSWSVAVD